MITTRLHGSSLPRKSAVLTAAAALVLTGLTAGCSAIQDAGSTAVSAAACAAATPIADELGQRTQEVLDDIALDPSGAVSQLTTWRDGLEAAASGVDGRLGAALDELVNAVDEVLTAAGSGAEGVTITPEDSERMAQQVRDAVAGVAGECD